MSDQEFSQYLRQNKLLLPKQPFHDDFLDVMKTVFSWSCLFGVFGSRRYISLLWSTIILGFLLVIEVLAIWKVIRAFAGVARDISGHRSITARLAGSIFYSISILSLIMASKLCYSWKNLAAVWAKVELAVGVKVPADRTLKRRMYFVVGFMSFFSMFEHVVSVISAVGLDCPPSLLLKRYTLVSHGFIFLGQLNITLFDPEIDSGNLDSEATFTTTETLMEFDMEDYSDWFAVPLAIISTIASLLWNFQDQLIILISMGLASRYRRLNECVAKVCALEKKRMHSDRKSESVKVYTWRKIREAYVKQAMLVRRIDVAIGGIIVLSCSCNFYFICLQMFLGISKGPSSELVTEIYHVISLGWLCIRVICVVLAASDVNVHSRIALKYLYGYESHRYNVEVERLQDQLTKDYIALSGMSFFYLNKTILLQMAGSIITYELVLIQFDDSDAVQLNTTLID